MPQLAPGYATPNVTIEEPEWQSFLKPIFKAFNGDDFYDDVLDLFDDEEDGDLDPWDGQVRSFVGGQTELPRDGAEPFKVTLPRTYRKDDHQADRWAAEAGMDFQGTGGTGNVIGYAKSMLGRPYVWGAEDPKIGFDCSGLIYWAFNRAGYDIPRVTAREYQNVFKHVPRDELQPGDVLFYSYGRLGKGVVDHIEIYMGDGKQIGTSNVREDLDIDPVDMAHLVGGGRLEGAGRAVAAKPAKGGGKRSPKVVTKPVLNETSTVPSSLAGDSPELVDVLSSTLRPPQTFQVFRERPGGGKLSKGVKQQLIQGFEDAGRADLARMVRTKAFDTWIQAESGWRVDVTSPPNNNGLANDGLFQIWRGHSYNANGQVAQMTAYEQAQVVARYFGHLTPAKIREYAKQIDNGSYSGWG